MTDIDLTQSEPYQQGHTSSWLRYLADALYDSSPYVLIGMRLVRVEPMRWCDTHNLPSLEGSAFCHWSAGHVDQEPRPCAFSDDAVYRVAGSIDDSA